MRLALALVLAVLVGQALIYPVSAALEQCTETCPDDRTDGTCEPTCTDCTCCAHGSRPPVAIPSIPATEPVSSFELGLFAAPPPTEADPRDVFHVPRPLA